MIELAKSEFKTILNKVKEVEFNTYFAQSVIVGHAKGTVYVNDRNNPTAIYIVSDYGMSLLFGDCSDAVFNQALIDYFTGKDCRRKKAEWLQAYPIGWADVLKPLVEQSNIVEQYSRVNFSFDKTIFKNNNLKHNLSEFTIIRTPVELFLSVNDLVAPKYFWQDKFMFEQHCVSFTLMYEGKPVSTAFTSCLHDDKLEIGIETEEAYRGKGFASMVCTALINYCLENGLEPVWSCRLENTGSFNLAQKLGFVPTLIMPYYFIK